MKTAWIAVLATAALASSFDVASVKTVNPPAGPHTVSLIIDHDRLNIEAAELRQIIGLAYGIQRVRVVDGPRWADADQFDIAAKAASPNVTRDEIRSMLQTLLAERFQLRVHRETKEIATYSLSLAKSGPRFQEAAPGTKTAVSHGVNPEGVPRTVFQASSIRTLANMVANILGSPVEDHTGLTGTYDFTVEWLDSGTSLVASMEQIGLKLEAKKAPVEVLVVDRAEKPSAN